MEMSVSVRKKRAYDYRPLSDREDRLTSLPLDQIIEKTDTARVRDLLHMPAALASTELEKAILAIQRRPFGEAVISLARMPPGVLKMPVGQEASPLAEFRLSVCLNSASLRSEGTATDVRRGDAILLDTATDWAISTDRSTTWLSLSLPRHAIASRFAGASTPTSSVPTLPALVMRKSDPMVRLFRSGLIKLWQTGAGIPNCRVAETAETQIDMFIEAVRVVLNDSIDQRKQKLASLLRISDVVQAELKNPAFDAAELTRRLKTTPKDLARVLGDISPTDLIRQQRLDQARRLLRSGAARRLTISQIGRSVGFGNLPHFSTLYGNTFGSPPHHDQSS